MDNDEMRELNKDFADFMQKMTYDFMKVFERYMKKNKRATIVCALHLPINLIMNLMAIVPKGEKTLSACVPDLPGMFTRFLLPFVEIEHLWGEIPDAEFPAEYRKVHEAQFDSWYKSPEQKQAFKNWFDAENKKRNQK